MVQDRKELFTSWLLLPFRHMGKVPRRRYTCILIKGLVYPGKFGGSLNLANLTVDHQIKDSGGQCCS